MIYIDDWRLLLLLNLYFLSISYLQTKYIFVGLNKAIYRQLNNENPVNTSLFRRAGTYYCHESIKTYSSIRAIVSVKMICHNDLPLIFYFTFTILTKLFIKRESLVIPILF
jgi:hypothetical protein